MINVLIWDYVGVSAQWINDFTDKKDFHIVGTITPADPVPEILLQKDAWDWLLIFEQGTRNFFDATIRLLNLPPDKVIYALDINSWAQHPKGLFALTNPQRGGQLHLYFNFIVNQNLNNFVTCTAEDCSYVATAKDSTIMRSMCLHRKNFSSKTMNTFHRLTEKYYGMSDGGGLFLDLGANIGTTGIYFLKKLTPNLKLLAFEPDSENFKLLRINLLLNDLETRSTAVNCGLGDKFDEMTMYRNLQNPGANRLFNRNDGFPTETVKIMPLDAYFAEQKIPAQDVKYVWIDTEGFEPQVILGAKNLLKENPAPVFMECNLRTWDKSATLEPMLAFLSERYSHFIHVQGGDAVYPLEALRTIKRPNNPGGQIGDIFLIRKGAID